MLHGVGEAVARPEWRASQNVATGKGARVQAFVAALGFDSFEIEVARHGERAICALTDERLVACRMGRIGGKRVRS